MASIKSELAALKESPFALSDEALADLCSRVIEAPRTTAEVASGEKNIQKRSKLQDRLEGEMKSLLSLLGYLKVALPTRPTAIGLVSEKIFGLIELQIPEISCRAFDVLRAIFESWPSGLQASVLEALISRLLEAKERSSVQSREMLIAFLDAISAGILSLGEKTPSNSLAAISALFPCLLSLSTSEHEEVRQRAREKTSILLSDTNTDDLASMEHIVQCLEADLGANEGDSIVDLCPIIISVFRIAGRGSTVASSLLARLDTIRTSLPEEQQTNLVIQAGDTNGDLTPYGAINKCLAAAVAHLGVKSVISVLPLNLTEALGGMTASEPRTWLLPLIEKQARTESLKFWMEYFLPAARLTRDKATSIAGSDPELVFKLKTVERQIWLTLKGFTRSPVDADHTFQSISEVLLQAWAERPDLRSPISSSLHNLASYIADQTPDSRFGDGIRVVSDRFVEVIAISVVDSTVEDKSAFDAMGSLARLCSQSTVDAVFKEAKSRIYKAIRDSVSDPSLPLFEILVSLLPVVSLEGLKEIVQAAELFVQSGVGPQVQKKSYKILHAVMEHRPESWTVDPEGVARTLNGSRGTCLPPSKSFRLKCIATLFSPNYPGHPSFDQRMDEFWGEVLETLAEGNVKAKKEAGSLVICLGQKYIDGGRVEELLSLIRAGLTNGVQSCSIAAGAFRQLAITLDNFRYVFPAAAVEDFLQLSLHLLKERRQEFSAKHYLLAVLDLFDQIVRALPTDRLVAHLGSLMECLLEWDKPLKRAREETKALVMSIGEIVGFDQVHTYVPEHLSRVMRNLRYAIAKSSRRSTMATPNPTSTVGSRKTTRSGAIRGQEEEATEMADLLDPTEARRLSKAAVGGDQHTEAPDSTDDGFVLPTNEEGKLIVNEKTLKRAEKAMGRRSKELSDDFIDDDLAIRSTKSSSFRSASKQSNSHRSKTKTTKSSIKSHHSGKRFKAKRAGGDTKGKARLEPYAYWRLDRRLLNKRIGKRKTARSDLRRILGKKRK